LKGYQVGVLEDIYLPYFLVPFSSVSIIIIIIIIIIGFFVCILEKKITFFLKMKRINKTRRNNAKTLTPTPTPIPIA